MFIKKKTCATVLCWAISFENIRMESLFKKNSLWKFDWMKYSYFKIKWPTNKSLTLAFIDIGSQKK